MSADACIIYFGLRYETTEHEIQGLEERSDPRIVAARRVGLRVYWGNFSDGFPRYLLFVGSEIARLGPENALESKRAQSDLASVIDKTVARLKEAGLEGDPELHMQWEPDL